MALQLIREGVCESISPQTVQRILDSHKLKPWRVHYWLSPKTPRDEEFRRRVQDICDLYTRPLPPTECVLSVDEKTSIQPRPRTCPNKPARPGNKSIKLEHEYKRAGALNLLAAFDIRTGKVTGILRRRKRQVELIELLEEVERKIPRKVKIIHLICDNLIMHRGKMVQKWLIKHPRIKMHFTPVHCSWMNQVEQWFSIFQRKRLTAPNFKNLDDLKQKIEQFISEWNEIAHPFRWTEKSFSKTMGKIEAYMKAAA
jgi:transposase